MTVTVVSAGRPASTNPLGERLGTFLLRIAEDLLWRTLPVDHALVDHPFVEKAIGSTGAGY